LSAREFFEWDRKTLLRSSYSVILFSMELIFEVREAEEGGFNARALGHAIFTQAETWDELRRNVLEAAALHFEDTDALDQLSATQTKNCI